MARINWYTILISIQVAFGGFLFGYDSGNIAGVMQMGWFIKVFGHPVPEGTHPGAWGAQATIDGILYQVSSVEKSLITSFLSIGTFIGALAGGFLADYLGRKGAIIISGVVFLAGVACQTACSSVPVMIVGRCIAGLGVGVISMATPLFLAEISPPLLRGSLTSVYQLMITAGIMSAQGIDWATSQIMTSASWRVPIGLQCLWGLILLCGCSVIPESPRYLVKRGNTGEALKNLAKMRAGGEITIEVREEFSNIINNWEYELSLGDASYKECLRGTNRRRTMLGLCVQMLQQLTGINFILYYGTTWFSEVGVSDPYLVTLLTGVVNTIFTLPGIYGVERLGRRTLLISGAISMCICELLIGIVAVASNDSQASAIILIVFSIAFIASFASTWGPGAWVLTGEVFPLKLRGKGMSLAAASNWWWNWVLAFTAPYMSDRGYGALGSKIAFVWSATCCGAGLWAWVFCPETRYLSLEELDELFEARLPAWKTRTFQPTGVSITDPNLLRQSGGYYYGDMEIAQQGSQELSQMPNGEKSTYPPSIRSAQSGRSLVSEIVRIDDTSIP